jgi:ABC-type sugar transport system substrate-binding protein
VRDGTINATLVQKREAFETWALRMLDSIARGTDPVMRKYTDQGFPMIPTESLTGVIVVTKDNIDKLF